MPRSSRTRRTTLSLRLVRPLVLGAGVFALAQPLALANDPPLQFNSGFMYQGAGNPAHAGQLVLDTLATRNTLGPGRYRVALNINLRTFDHREIEFFTDAQGQLKPCLPGALLEEIGLKLGAVADQAMLDQACVDLAAAVAGAFTDLDVSTLTLTVSIPQIAMRRDRQGLVAAERWDAGINSAFVNYQASTQYGHSANGRVNQSQNLHLLSGINLGAWRLRSSQSLRNDDSGSQWQRAFTYLQRDMPGTRARLTLGETYTGGDVFKSLPIVGATLATDMGMLSDNAQSYAPVIRGVALSRAQVEVRQNGYALYSTYVSAGPFEIDDLSTGGGSGELEIIITEADGQVRRFTQAYAGLANLLRQGTIRYRVAAGRYNSSYADAKPLVWQGDLAMGMGWQSTLYGGLLFNDDYQAGNLGISRDFGALGGLSFDVTQSDADIGHDSLRGHSYALRYGKAFASRTNLRFAGYRYSSENYRDFDEALNEHYRSSNYRGSRRSRLEASLYQGLGERSNLSLTLSQEDYWRSDQQRRQFQLYFSTSHRDISYNLYASQSLADGTTPSDRQFGITVSLPLNDRPRATASLDASKSGEHWSQRASVSGSLDDHRYNYSASVSQQAERQRSAALSLAHQGPMASGSVGFTQGDDYRNLSLNVSGALLAHAGGIALGPYLGETMGLVHVPDTPGIGIANAGAARTNAAGYALIPYLQPYRANQIELKGDQLGPELALENGTTQLVPTRGAVVKATFNVLRQQPVVISAQGQDGKPLPFGAQVVNQAGEMLSVVGQAGQIMFATLDGAQTVHVQWADTLCQLHLDPQTMTDQDGYRMQALTCDRNVPTYGARTDQEPGDEA